MSNPSQLFFKLTKVIEPHILKSLSGCSIFQHPSVKNFFMNNKPRKMSEKERTVITDALEQQYQNSKRNSY